MRQYIWVPLPVHPVIHVIVMAVAVWIAWQNRQRRPLAATLFLIAVLLSLLDVVLRFLEGSHMVLIATPLTFSSGLPDLSSLATWMFLTWQAIKCGLRIASWSLLAWAILMRPNDPVSPPRP